jgi:hypothetical protein
VGLANPRFLSRATLKSRRQRSALCSCRNRQFLLQLSGHGFKLRNHPEDRRCRNPERFRNPAPCHPLRSQPRDIIAVHVARHGTPKPHSALKGQACLASSRGSRVEGKVLPGAEAPLCPDSARSALI